VPVVLDVVREVPGHDRTEAGAPQVLLGSLLPPHRAQAFAPRRQLDRKERLLIPLGALETPGATTTLIPGLVRYSPAGSEKDG